ncbi:glutamate--tRNA ligase [bacterium]|nr:glutamate--tRNA ligase [bacterium]
MFNEVRVRYAPSPTGFLHIGGLRTALYNYLFARHHNGKFILRVEDTDRARFVEGAVEDFLNMLDWAGIEIDEGPNKDGGFGPYYQSQRLDLYEKHAKQLLDEGKAYRCFCSSERLDQMRKFQEKSKLPPKYDRTCLRLSQDEIQKKLEAGESFTVRMKVPDETTIRFTDLIRGEVEFSSFNVDDQVLVKSDGYPTYHLANVVDDHFMKISHVIRGEEWVSSTPKHVLLYQYFGWDLPQFAHLPLLLNADRSKMSKRQGDVEARAYPPKGYLKEAVVNFISLLGWNPGDEREIFTMEELIKEFSIERIHKAGAVFNVDKLNWLNTMHIRRKSDEEIYDMLKSDLEKHGYSDYPKQYVLRTIGLMKERINFIHELLTFSGYFFKDPETFDAEGIKKRWTPEAKIRLTAIGDLLEQSETFMHDDIEKVFRSYADEIKIKASELIHPVRLAISGMTLGPGLFDLMSVLGQQTVIRRIRHAVAHFDEIIAQSK